MATEIEYELTYLAKELPAGLEACESKILADVYFPGTPEVHPKLHIRRKGDSYELTKKTIIDENDLGTQQEETIALSAEEYEALAQGYGKKVSKRRYYYPYQGLTSEVDVFDGDLSGLILVDFEFPDAEAKAAFVMPDFCVADVTQEEFVAGGYLAGKTIADIQTELGRFLDV